MAEAEPLTDTARALLDEAAGQRSAFPEVWEEVTRVCTRSGVECSVCYVDVDRLDQFRCSGLFCATVVCGECLQQYCRSCFAQASWPGCVDPECQGQYLWSELSSLVDPEASHAYMRRAFDDGRQDASDALLARAATRRMVADLQAQRREFVAGLPAAVALTAQIAMQQRLRRVRRQQTGRSLRQGLAPQRRRCMVYGCTGFLDADFCCVACLQAFCRQCEAPKANDAGEGAHRCDPDLVSSVAAVDGFSRCPKCCTPVERASGCRNMTCAVCRTRFDYHTSEVGGTGAVGNAPVHVREFLSELVPRDPTPPPSSRSLSGRAAAVRACGGSDNDSGDSSDDERASGSDAEAMSDDEGNDEDNDGGDAAAMTTDGDDGGFNGSRDSTDAPSGSQQAKGRRTSRRSRVRHHPWATREAVVGFEALRPPAYDSAAARQAVFRSLPTHGSEGEGLVYTRPAGRRLACIRDRRYRVAARIRAHGRLLRGLEALVSEGRLTAEAVAQASDLYRRLVTNKQTT